MSMNPNAGADRMGTMPVGRLLISMAVPMMFSMMVTALYNVVDSIFVARVSENALDCGISGIPCSEYDDCHCSWYRYRCQCTDFPYVGYGRT